MSDSRVTVALDLSATGNAAQVLGDAARQASSLATAVRGVTAGYAESATAATGLGRAAARPWESVAAVRQSQRAEPSTQELIDNYAAAQQQAKRVRASSPAYQASGILPDEIGLRPQVGRTRADRAADIIPDDIGLRDAGPVDKDSRAGRAATEREAATEAESYRRAVAAAAADIDRRAAAVERTARIEKELQAMGKLPPPLPPVTPQMEYARALDDARKARKGLNAEEERRPRIEAQLRQEGVLPTKAEERRRRVEKYGASQREEELYQRELKKSGYKQPSQGQGGAMTQVADKVLGTDIGGALANLALPLAAVYGGLKVMESGLTTAAKGLNILNSSVTTYAQKQQQLTEGLPVVGSLFQAAREFKESLAGVGESMYQQQNAHARSMARATAGQSEYMEADALNAERGHLLNRSRAIHNAQLVSEPNIDRSTMAGEIAYQRAQRMLPHQDRQAMAGAESAAARMDKKESDQRLRELEKDQKDAEAKRDKAMREVDRVTAIENQANPTARGNEGMTVARAAWMFNNPLLAGIQTFRDMSPDIGAGPGERNQVGRAKALNEWELASEAVIRTNTMRRAEAARNEALGRAIPEKDSAARKAGIDGKRDQLEFLRQDETRLTGQMQSFGGMREWEKDRLVNVAMGAKNKKWKELSPYEQGLIRQASPDYAAKRMEADAKGDPRYRALQDMGIFHQGDREKVRGEIRQLNTEIRVEVKLDEEKYARETAAALVGPIGDKIQSIVAALKERLDRVELGIRQAQNH